MRTFGLFFGILLSVLAAVPAGAADLKIGTVHRSAACGEYCQRYKAAHPGPLRHVPFRLTCINFRQPGRDNVVITVYGGDRSIIYQRNKTKPTQGKFCFAQSLLMRASAIMLCDGVNTATINSSQVSVLQQQGGMTPTQYACLLGKRCANYRGERPQFSSAR